MNETIDKIIEDKETAILKFSADWCAPCKTLTKLLQKITPEFDIAVHEVDVDSEYEIAETYNVRAVPTLISFKDGLPVGSLTGLHDTKIYTEFFQSLKN